MTNIKALLPALLLGILVSCNNNRPDAAADNTPDSTSVSATPLINYYVVKIYPHDTTSFTEGLLVDKGRLFESTGSPDDLPNSRSVLGIVDLQTGKIDVKAELDRKKYFGEGIVLLNNKAYQLTYRTKVGFVYDATTFRKTGEFTFPGNEGWGMTTDGTSLILSDGTSTLTWMDPNTFKVTKTLRVQENGADVSLVNELEYIKGFIYANVYTTSDIIKIDPATGNVVGRLNLSSLSDEARIRYPRSLELNGIAYDSAADKIYVTGKLWPHLYEISFPH